MTIDDNSRLADEHNGCRIPAFLFAAAFSLLFPLAALNAADPAAPPAKPAAASSADKSPAAAAAAPVQIPQVGVIVLKKEAAPIVRTLPGRVKSMRVAQVRARVPGVLLRQKYVDGADVKEGDLLFEIEGAVYEARRASAAASVEQAKANIERASASLTQAALLAKRYRELIGTKSVSQQELDAANAAELQGKADLAGARANLLAAQAALKSAEIDLGYTRVVAPISGRIGRPLVTEGALVGQGEVTQLAEINQIESVHVDIVQPAGELLALRQKAGANLDRVRITLQLEDGTEYARAGKPLLSEIAVDPATSSVAWRVEFPNPDKLLWPGMYVRARFAYDGGAPAFRIPMQAIKRDSATAAASVHIVTADNRIAAVPVQSMEPSGPYWVVRQTGELNKELREGMNVIVEGDNRAMLRLAPGSPVIAVPWKPNTPKPGAPPSPFEK